MIFLRLLIILMSAILMFTTTESFAASGSVVTTTGSTSTKIKNIEKDQKDTNLEESQDADTEEKKVEDKKTEINFSRLTTEMFKLQGNKILRDIDKAYPNDSTRLDVYYGIKKTLTLRKKNIEKSEFSNDAKEIILDYLSYMISSIEKKIKNLE